MKPLDKENRESLRAAFYILTRELPEDAKMHRGVRAFMREAVMAVLMPYLPDPFISALMFAKDVPTHVALTINDPDEATAARIGAIGYEDPIPDELEPYVLLVPFEIYEAANERNMLRWVTENAPPFPNEPGADEPGADEPGAAAGETGDADA
jgi:hypothetical protein